VSFEVTEQRQGLRRRSIYIDGYEHANPIPAACRIENVVYSSLIHGIDRSQSGHEPTLDEQAALMFARLREIVEAAGGNTDDIVKVTMWMSDRRGREAVNRYWLEMFPDPSDRPARQTINTELDGQQLIQCDFVAVINQQREGGERS
jgi:2-iminobutanoate/2-iminopropanoate deaminase